VKGGAKLTRPQTAPARIWVPGRRGEKERKWIDMTIPQIEIDEELASLKAAAGLVNLRVPKFVLPESHHVVLRGHRFHYLDWGKNGPPILFLHGAGLTAHTYDLVCLALRTEYQCISLDQRGHGDSEWSPVLDYSNETQAGDIVAFVEHMGWDHFLLVGMSMGGVNSIFYAGRHSNRLAGLVIIDAGPELRPVGTARIGEFLRQPDALDSIEEFVERALRFNPRRDPRLLRRSLRHSLRQRPDGKWVWKADPRPREQNARQAPLPDRYKALWAEVEHITCPTLVLRGAESDVLLDEDAERLASRLPNGRWVKIPHAGHTVQGDNPTAIVDAIRNFLAEVGY